MPKNDGNEDESAPDTENLDDKKDQEENPRRSDGNEDKSAPDTENLDDKEDQEGTARPSYYYVLGKKNVNRSCHLPRSEEVDVKARKKLIIASVVCLVFIIVEVLGGVLSNSLAIASDAAHLLTDFAGFMISLFAIWLAGRNATDRLSFGWYRAEVIGALASVMTIWCVTGILVYMAILRCINRDFEIESVLMIATAVFGLVVNVILGVILIQNSTTEMECPSDESITEKRSRSRNAHGHSHGCSGKVFTKIEKKLNACFDRIKERFKKKPKEPTPTTTKKCQRGERNINVTAAIVHVLGDAVQSVGVLLAGIIIYFQPTWVLADPIITFIFSVIVLYTTVQTLKTILLVLMEGTPTYMRYNEVQKVFENIEGVKSTHGLRIWALNVDKIALAVHLVTERNVDPIEILAKAEKAIHKHYHLYETTIQIEEDTESLIDINSRK